MWCCDDDCDNWWESDGLSDEFENYEFNKRYEEMYNKLEKKVGIFIKDNLEFILLDTEFCPYEFDFLEKGKEISLCHHDNNLICPELCKKCWKKTLSL